MKKSLLTVLGITLMLTAGCCMMRGGKPCGKKPAPAPEPVKAVQVQKPCANAGDSGVIKIEKMLPQTVSVGKAFDYKILVKNTSCTALADVQVVETLPAGFEFKSAMPTAKVSGNQLLWEMPLLEANATKELVVTGMVKDQGTFQSCAVASYKMPACAQFVATMPDVTLTKTATTNAGFCDPIVIKYTATNKGTGAATGLMITDTLPEGLVTSQGQNTVSVNVGELAAGQSKAFTVTAKPTKTGTFTSKATLKGGDISVQSGETSSVVVRPVLKVSASAPKMVYLGRGVTFDIKVDNEGDGAANNVEIVASKPANAKFTSATDMGKVLEGNVTWKLGQMAPKASKTVSVTLTPESAMTVMSSVKAMATCAEAVTAQAQADVKGIPAVLLEVVDISDPIEVGQTETYVITVTNQGSAADTNIAIKAILEDNMEYVSSSGVTIGTLADKTVTFAPLATLAPKTNAQWMLKVKAVKAGDVRFKIVLNTDQLGRDVEETEATNFYE